MCLHKKRRLVIHRQNLAKSASFRAQGRVFSAAQHRSNFQAPLCVFWYKFLQEASVQRMFPIQDNAIADDLERTLNLWESYSMAQFAISNISSR